MVLLTFTSLSSFAQPDDLKCGFVDNGGPSFRAPFDCTAITFANVDEALAAPTIDVNVVYHFEQPTQGQGWVCDSNDPAIAIYGDIIRAPTYLWYIEDNIKNRFEEFILNAPAAPASVRINWNSDRSCDGIQFFTGSPTYVPDAYNVVIRLRSSGSCATCGGCGGYVSSLSSDFGVNCGVLDRILAGTSKFWEDGRTMIHEWGHTLSLDHTFNCNADCANEPNGFDPDLQCGNGTPCSSSNTNPGNCFNGDNTTLMNHGTGSNTTICELGEMYTHIYSTQSSYEDLCATDNPYMEVLIDDGGTVRWDTRKIFDADVRVDNNPTLIMTCDVLMGDNHRIVVGEGSKLILDGGRITTYCDDHVWAGIRAYGGNNDFDVKTMNNAVIENVSKDAISTLAPEPWPDVTNWGNGIVHLQNTTFNNCNRVLQLMAWSSAINGSYMRGCTVNGGKWGIAMWGGPLEVVVEDNTFSGLQRSCIETGSGHFRTIRNNTFDGAHQDILFVPTSPGYSYSSIDFNYFGSPGNGIHSTGSQIDQHQIDNNQFYVGETGVLMDAENYYYATNNDFVSDFGVAAFENTGQLNDVVLNQFSGNLAGQLTVGDNSGYRFLLNCFNTSMSDLFIDGSVADFQGQQGGGPANNCFSHSGNAFDVRDDITGDPNPFVYVEPLDEIEDCLDAVKAHPNVILDERGEPYNPCSAAGTGGPISTPVYYPCRPQRTDKATAEAVAWLEAKILEIANNNSLSDLRKQQLIYQYERCLCRVKRMRASIFLEDGLADQSRAELTSSLGCGGNLDSDRALIFATYMIEGDKAGAYQYLSTLADGSESAAMSDFIALQQVAGHYYDMGPFYQPTTQDLDVVYEIATAGHHFSGYAKSLWYHWTDELLMPQYPDVFGTQERSAESSLPATSSPTVEVSPNPFDESLLVQIDDLLTGVADLTIYDMMGRVLYNQKCTDGSLTIDARSFRPGIYIVRLMQGDDQLYTERFIKH